MLVLTRKQGEQVRIGPDIEVTVLAIHGRSVKLGFSAPPEVPIHRREVAQQLSARTPARAGAAGYDELTSETVLR